MIININMWDIDRYIDRCWVCIENMMFIIWCWERRNNILVHYWDLPRRNCLCGARVVRKIKEKKKENGNAMNV